MITYKCDICGKETNDFKHIVPKKRQKAENWVFLPLYQGIGVKFLSIDGNLCNDCYEAICSIIEERKSDDEK